MMNLILFAANWIIVCGGLIIHTEVSFGMALIVSILLVIPWNVGNDIFTVFGSAHNKNGGVFSLMSLYQGSETGNVISLLSFLQYSARSNAISVLVVGQAADCTLAGGAVVQYANKKASSLLTIWQMAQYYTFAFFLAVAQDVNDEARYFAIHSERHK